MGLSACLADPSVAVLKPGISPVACSRHFRLASYLLP